MTSQEDTNRTPWIRDSIHLGRVVKSTQVSWENKNSIAFLPSYLDHCDFSVPRFFCLTSLKPRLYAQSYPTPKKAKNTNQKKKKRLNQNTMNKDVRIKGGYCGKNGRPKKSLLTPAPGRN